MKLIRTIFMANLLLVLSLQASPLHDAAKKGDMKKYRAIRKKQAEMAEKSA